MDLVCLILLIIDLFKPSMALSIVTVALCVFEIFLLVGNKREFSSAYAIAIIGIVVGVIKICIL